MKKSVIIYLPSGVTLQYSTVDLNDSNFIIAKEILPLTAMQSLQIVEADGTRVTFTGIPFMLDEWE